MAASCTFGISFTIGTGNGNDDFIEDPSPITPPAHNFMQYEDGLCPYSDEKEVVVDEGNYADRSVWRTTTTTEDLVANEDSSSSITTADNRALNDHQAVNNAQSMPGMLHCTRAWRITKSAVKNASSSTTKYLTTSAPHQSDGETHNFGLSVISRAEFEKLPLTIQRKHFSTIERLRLARDLGDIGPQHADPTSAPYSAHSHSARATTAHSWLDKEQRPHSGPAHRSATGSKSCDFESRNYPRLSSLDQELLTRLPDKVKRQHLTREEQLLAQHQQFIAQHRNPSGLLDDLERERSKRHKRLHHLDLAEILESCSTASVLISTDMSPSEYASIHDRINQDHQDQHDFYDTIRWLEQDQNLDLRLGIDEPEQGVPTEPKPQFDTRPPVRRHLSLTSRLSFSRPSLTIQSRPATNDAAVAPRQHPTPSHVRTRSRALSLMSPQNHTRQGSSAGPDGAAHYQDPEARMILRSHLASPQKFDEALEFGFPSVDDERRDIGEPSGQRGPDPLDELRTWLNDDKSSTYSEKSSMPDSESPRTPPLIDRPAVSQPYRVPNDPSMMFSGDHGQPPVREMTLRMTLTRPDLRAGDSDIYGWQQNVQPARAHHVRGDSFAQGTGFRQMSPKSSIERQFSAMDHDLSNQYDNGTLKRFWNRVRRT